MVDLTEALTAARTPTDAARDAAAPRWYVVTDAAYKYDDLAGLADAKVWTISRDPACEGWSTDAGYDGYGLTYADAKELADAANAVWLARKA